MSDDDDKVGRLPKPGKLYYSIREAAEMLGESTTTVRYWENTFDFLRPHRNKKGNRLFTVKDLDRLRTLHYLIRECGLTLKGASDMMKSQIAAGRSGPTEEPRVGGDDLQVNAEVVARLKNVRDLLEMISDELLIRNQQQ